MGHINFNCLTKKKGKERLRKVDWIRAHFIELLAQHEISYLDFIKKTNKQNISCGAL